MSNFISLEGSIRTCKVDTGWASKLESDRFLNSNVMLCPPWNGVDTSGRPVCSDSYWTKNAGCNSANDRVLVENDLRPKYMEYVTLDASGIRGDGQCYQGNAYPDTVCGSQKIANVHNYTGQFGLQTDYNQSIFPNCVTCSVGQDSAQLRSQQMRNQQMVKEGFKMSSNKKSSGFLGIFG